MLRKSLLLCGIIATGDSLNFRGISSLMSFHLMMRENPLVTLASASSMRHFSAWGTFAVGCAPYSRAVIIRSWFQSGPQSTGHPESAYSFRSVAAACCRANDVGCISAVLCSFNLPILLDCRLVFGKEWMRGRIALCAAESASSWEVICILVSFIFLTFGGGSSTVCGGIWVGSTVLVTMFGLLVLNRRGLNCFMAGRFCAIAIVIRIGYIKGGGGRSVLA